MQAMQMGIQSQERTNEHLARQRNFEFQQKQYEDTSATRELGQRTAQEQLKRAKEWATDKSIGVDKVWEKDNLTYKWLPEMEKVGYERRQLPDGSHGYWKNGKRMRASEMASDSDVAGIIIGNMDPSFEVRKQYELEQGRLEELLGGMADDMYGGDEEAKNRIIDQQKALVQQYESQLVDMERAPIKYLNHQIDTLGDLMSHSLNPQIHMLKYKDLQDRRNALIEQQTKLAEAAGKTTNLYQAHLYDCKGDIIFTDWLRKGESPMRSKRVQDFIKARKSQKLETYYDVPQSVKRANQAISAYLSNSAAQANFIAAVASGDQDRASGALKSLFRAAEMAAGVQQEKEDAEIDKMYDHFRTMGINMFDGTTSPDNLARRKGRVIEYLKENFKGMSKQEMEQKAVPYFRMLNVAANRYTAQ
jgi:hypothetical protein